MSLRFDEQVVIVTGGGNGLGRSHALEFARRGARVVVNDLGGSRDGSGGSESAAEAVVREIREAGGEAIANAASVTDAAAVDAMVATTLDTWGRVDALVNNAGILRDKTFAKVTLDDFRAVVDVHLMGSVICSRAVWPVMRERGYGRIVMTTSSSGLYGNFGQSNYGAAKMGLVGLMNTLHLEGARYGIHVNTLAPVAATRMTEDLMPPDVLALLNPEYVTPAVVFLASSEAPSRQIVGAGAGVFSRVLIQETAGVFLSGDDLNADSLAARFAEVVDTAELREPQQGGDQTMGFLTRAARELGIDIKG